MKLKGVFKRDRQLFRLFRLLWVRGQVGDGKGYSKALSFALCPKLFTWKRGENSWILYIFGVRIHSQKSKGGIHV